MSWTDLGEWIAKKKKYPDADNLYERLVEIGYQEFKVRIKLDKKNQDTIRAMLKGDSPQFYSRWIDLVCDVWGMAGPDGSTRPV